MELIRFFYYLCGRIEKQKLRFHRCLLILTYYKLIINLQL